MPFGWRMEVEIKKNSRGMNESTYPVIKTCGSSVEATGFASTRFKYLLVREIQSYFLTSVEGGGKTKKKLGFILYHFAVFLSNPLFSARAITSLSVRVMLFVVKVA